MLWRRDSIRVLLVCCGLTAACTARTESVSLIATADTGLQEFRPTTTGGAGTGLRVGTVGRSGGGGRVRALFRFDAKAQCALHDASVEAPVLEQANRAVGRPAVSTEEHAELGATYVFRCAQPARLTTLEVLLFDAFRRVERIDVKTALPQGQSKTVLRRSARVVRLAK